jgi:hypothetical protein
VLPLLEACLRYLEGAPATSLEKANLYPVLFPAKRMWRAILKKLW